MPETIIVPASEWAATAAQRIAEDLRRAVDARGWASLALAGGGTPKPVYAQLARAELPWEHIEIFFGDERCVPLSHPDSNYKMAVEALAGGPPLASFHPMVGPRDLATGDWTTAAQRYAAVLVDEIDVVLLGMGGDGHTASLFPGDASAIDAEQAVVPVIGPKPPPERITLTPRALQAARSTYVLVVGQGKAERVASVLRGDDLHQYPVRVALNGTWLLDEGAGSAL